MSSFSCPIARLPRVVELSHSDQVINPSPRIQDSINKLRPSQPCPPSKTPDLAGRMESGTGTDPPDQGTAEGPSYDSTQPPPATMSRHGEGSSSAAGGAAPLSRYESQKRRDWNTFLQYLKNHKPPLSLARCSGAHVIEFLKYLDQFGKTKVHATGCPYFGHPDPPGPCACPLKQAWGSLDALVGRLRAAYEENGGRSETNPLGAKAVRIYLREVRGDQAKARGIPYEKKKKKRKRPNVSGVEGTSHQEGSTGEGGSGVGGGESVGGDTS